jgi:hypothetical protein
MTDPARRNLRDESLELPMVAREALTFRNGRETVRPRHAVGTAARDPLPKSRRPRSRCAIVSAYDHRVGRRDDAMCHYQK